MRLPEAQPATRPRHLPVSLLLVLCALAVFPGAPATAQAPPAPGEIEQLFRKGLELSAQGLIEPAIVAFQEVVAKDPKNVDARLELGKLALRAQNWAYAIQMFGELVALKPEDAELRRVVMEVYESYNMEIETLQTAIELARLVPDDAALLARLAKLYREHGLIPEEIETYQRLAALRPTDPGPLWKLGELYEERARPREQRAAYEGIRRLTPDDPKILRRLARVYGEQGLYQEQIAIYEALQRREPDAPLLRLALAQARQEAGRTIEDLGNYWLAREFYRRALQDDPAIEPASRGIERTTRLLRPSVGHEYLWEDYRLESDTFRRTYRVFSVFPLPLSGARLRVENATILVRGGGERVLANDTGLSWEQMVGSSLRLRAGGSGMAVAEGFIFVDPETTRQPRDFSGQRFGFHVGGTWQSVSRITFPLITFSTAVKREQITDSPRAFEQSIQRLSFDNELSVSVDVFERPLSVSGVAKTFHYSDGNDGTTLGAWIEYALLYGKPEPVEDPGAVPVEERGRPQYKLAIEYGYEETGYDVGKAFYSSVVTERVHAGTVKAEILLLPRTHLSGSARFGTDQAGQRIRYYIGELSVNWLEPLRAFVRYEEGTTTARQGISSHERKFAYGIEYRF